MTTEAARPPQPRRHRGRDRRDPAVPGTAPDGCSVAPTGNDGAVRRPVDLVFHGRCPDGLTAAWVLGRALGVPATLVPFVHGDPVPAPAHSEVWVLDVAFAPEVLRAWAGDGRRVFVLDHHKSNAELLDGLLVPLEVTLARAADPTWCGLSATVTMERSGAGLAAAAATVLSPGFAVPDLVHDIEDRDLWRWQRDGSRAVCAAIDAEVDPEQLDAEAALAALDRLAGRPRAELAETGRRLIAALDERVAELCRNSRSVQVAGMTVPFAEIPEARFGSDVAHRLLALHPDAPFAGTWQRRPDTGSLRIGLRSEDRRADVAEIAARFGGGGHRNAAGLSCRDLADLAVTPPR